MKSGLRKKYKLSTEEFCRCLRIAKISTKKSFVEFPYGLNVDVVEWLRGANAHGDVEWFVDLICLEHFYEALPDRVCTWVLIPSGVDTIRRAAALADEYVLSRGQGMANNRPELPQGEKREGMPEPRLHKLPGKTDQATGQQRKFKKLSKLVKALKSRQKLLRLGGLRCAINATMKVTSPDTTEKKAPFLHVLSGRRRTSNC